MNTNEFNQWWGDFKSRFPDLGGQWFAEGRSAETQRAILATWSNLLSDIDLHEAIEINRAIQAGDIEGFSGKWDRDNIPAIIRKAVISRRPNENPWTGPNEPDEHRPRKRRTSEAIGSIFRTVTDMSDREVPANQIAEYIRTAFPPRPAWEHQQTFHCNICHDDGRVEVWHEHLVQLAVRGEWDEIPGASWRTMLCSCTCVKGQVFRERKIALPMYDEGRMCRVITGDTKSADAIDYFRAWLESARSIESKANYEQSFADYNNRG